jgi:hypothetical protein
VPPLHVIVAAVFGWLQRERRDVIEFLREENRVLKAQLHGRRLRLNDDERRRLAVIGHRLGRRILADVATIVRAALADGCREARGARRHEPRVLVWRPQVRPVPKCAIAHADPPA